MMNPPLPIICCPYREERSNLHAVALWHVGDAGMRHLLKAVLGQRVFPLTNLTLAGGWQLSVNTKERR